MKLIQLACTTLIFFLGACQAVAPASAVTLATETKTARPTFTSIPSPTITMTPVLTATQTAIPPTPTLTPICKCRPIPSTTLEPTEVPTGEGPGVRVQGYVTRPDGTGVSGALIYSALAMYPGNLIATSDQNGYYAAYIYIPGDETVRIWAESPGHAIKPGQSYKTWYNGEFAWRHYAGYEIVSLSFIATPLPAPT